MSRARSGMCRSPITRMRKAMADMSDRPQEDVVYDVKAPAVAPKTEQAPAFGSMSVGKAGWVVRWLRGDLGMAPSAFF